MRGILQRVEKLEERASPSVTHEDWVSALARDDKPRADWTADDRAAEEDFRRRLDARSPAVLADTAAWLAKLREPEGPATP